MATDADYGLDVEMFVGDEGPPDLDPYFGTVTGARAVAQAVTLRLYTPRADAPGYLIGAEDDGIFLPDFVQGGITQQNQFAIQSAVTAEVYKDERVESATVNVSGDLQNQRFTIEINGTTAEGPFELTLGVSSVKVELLELS